MWPVSVTIFLGVLLCVCLFVWSFCNSKKYEQFTRKLLWWDSPQFADTLVKFPHCKARLILLNYSPFLSQNRLNITKTIRKYSIDSRLNPTGSEFQSGPTTKAIKHDEETDEEYGEGSVLLNGLNFDRISHKWVYRHQFSTCKLV